MYSYSSFRRTAGRLRRLAGLLAAGLACTLPGVAAYAEAGELPDSFRAEYKVKIKIASGRAIWTLRQDGDGRYVFNTLTEASGIWRAFVRGRLEETSTFEPTDAGMRTTDYILVNEMGSRPRNGVYEFRWDEGVATGVYKEKELSLPIEQGIMDRALFPVQLMFDLSRGRRPDGYTVLDRDELVTYDMTYGEQQRIKTPAGEFDAIEIRHRTEDNEETRLWCAPELGYLPIKVEQYEDDSRMGTATLVEYATG